MFQKPAIGSVITLTTRYSNPSLIPKTKYREFTYFDVTVLPSEQWFGAYDIKITSDTPLMEYRTINMRNVVQLIQNNQSGTRNAIVDDASTRVIKGSKGNEYTVRYQGLKVLSCTCPQNSIRRMACKHMTIVEQDLKDGK